MGTGSVFQNIVIEKVAMGTESLKHTRKTYRRFMYII